MALGRAADPGRPSAAPELRLDGNAEAVWAKGVLALQVKAYGGHEHVRMHRALPTQNELGQLLQIPEIVLLTKEARLPVVPSLHDMLRDPR